jgi:AhpD family alkylhydroperoxidase
MVKTREEAYKEIEELGYPILKVFDNFPPSMASKLMRIMSVVTKEECDHLTPAEVTVISSVISAANGCEMWLSFHAAGLLGMEAMSQADLDILLAGGIPQTEKMNGDHGRLKVIAIAAKAANAHKGIILASEIEHLKALGIDVGNELAEILFIAANIQGLNQIMPHYVNLGAPIEDFLKQVGPFKDTVYKDLKSE